MLLFFYFIIDYIYIIHSFFKRYLVPFELLKRNISGSHPKSYLNFLIKSTNHYVIKQFKQRNINMFTSVIIKTDKSTSKRYTMMNLLIIMIFVKSTFSVCPSGTLEKTKLVFSDVCLVNEVLIAVQSKLTIIGSASLKMTSNFAVISSFIVFKDNSYFLSIITFEISVSSNVVFKRNTISEFRGYIAVELNSNYLIMDNAKTKFDCSVKITNKSSMKMTNNSFSFISKNMTVSDGVFSMSENATLESSAIISITNNGKIVIKSDVVRNNLKTKNILCEEGIIEMDKMSIITSSNITIKSKCIVIPLDRSIVDLPVFFTNYFQMTTNVVSCNLDCDIAYSPIGIKYDSIPNGLKLLQNGRLLRYGESNLIFCHLNESKNNGNNNYYENYCPCEDNNCYITPIGTIKTLNILINTDNFTQEETMKIKHKGKKSYEENTLIIGNTKISLVQVNSLVLNVISKKDFEISITSSTKSVLIASNVFIQMGEIKCKMGTFKNNVFSCIFQNDCTIGGVSVNKQCANCYDKYCEVCESSKDGSVCKKCIKKYINENGKCVEDSNCQLKGNNFCVKCKNGYVMNTNNICEKPIDFCIKKSRNLEVCEICEYGNILKKGKCFKKNESEAIVSTKSVISCNFGYYNEDGECKSCYLKYQKSVICTKKHIEKCVIENYIENNNCKQKKCNKNEIEEENGKCSQIIDKCITIENGMCIECEQKYIVDIVNNKCITTQSNCSISGSLGCYRCIDGKFLNAESGICDDCGGNCSSCFGESTKCTACKDGYFLSNNACVTNEELLEVCNKISAITRGCVECRDGYYRNGTDCNKCDVKCATCNTKEICLTCNSTNFLTSDNECESRSNIVGCGVEVTKNGCAKCVDGYFTFKTNQCKKCVGCASCVSETVCTSCDDSQILHETSCVDVVMVKNCVEVKKSKCTKCTFWHEASESGEYCYLKAVWWVFFISSLIFVIILVVALVII
ncbi:cysteine surface protein, putative, partial [Entamoeba invadens IP1]|uniref:cysteine surface protein, putative n=1 Tax=Entamoeba invadens IP1 TaxID=370355 RepID=UPI0002C3D879